MADRAHRCKRDPLGANAICVSKCTVAAAVGVLLRWCSSSEPDGPHARNDLRANGFFGSVSAARAGLLFFAAAFRRLDLSADPVTLVDQRAGSPDRFGIFDQKLKIKSQRRMEDDHAEFLICSRFIDRRYPLARWHCLFARASEARDEKGRSPAARRTRGPCAWPCLRVLRPVSEEGGPAGRGHRRGRSPTRGTICKELRFGAGALLFRLGRDAEEDQAASGTRLLKYL